jgi:hypothetical protein
MSKYIHAELMLQYAQDAMETDKPWERWQEKLAIKYEDCDSNPFWYEGRQYRRKPQTVKINGFEVPAPLKEALADGDEYFIEAPNVSEFYIIEFWGGGAVDAEKYDQMQLHRGIAHATKEGAIASCKARLGIDPNGESDG